MVVWSTPWSARTRKGVLGLDISDHGFGQAKKTASQADVHHLVECVESDARQTAFRSDHFEAVILTFSLHHIEEVHLALKEVQRILRPGGKVLIGEWVVVKEDQPRDGCYRFSIEEMEQMLREAGFQQVEVEQIEPSLVLVAGWVKP
jgi:ubiquinone/menaquinone biosynthesis C-methylase UbiE